MRCASFIGQREYYISVHMFPTALNTIIRQPGIKESGFLILLENKYIGILYMEIEYLDCQIQVNLHAK
jgi:hypothetical protein